MADISCHVLNDGLRLPEIGFGTYTLNGFSGVDAIVSGIRCGYRLLDSAFNYENEGALGEAVKKSGTPRDELLLTSKLPGRRQRFDEATRTIEESLMRSNLDYYDLYLIHWPNPAQNLYVEAWTALIDARKRGLIRSIGVCNFLPQHLQRLIDETGVAPSVNQIELHPFFPQAEQRAWNKAHGVVTESWSPLARGDALLQNPVLINIASEHGKSVGQIVLRWHIELGALPIPKSANPQRQAENMAIFDFSLTKANMEEIATLARPDGRMANQDPAFYEEF